MKLKTYDVEVEMTVRRTLRVRAMSPEMARELGGGFLQMAADGHTELSGVLKWTDGRAAYRPMPIETILYHHLTAAEPEEVPGEAFGETPAIAGADGKPLTLSGGSSNISADSAGQAVAISPHEARTSGYYWVRGRPGADGASRWEIAHWNPLWSAAMRGWWMAGRPAADDDDAFAEIDEREIVRTATVSE
jgi:hypothetical protein